MRCSSSVLVATRASFMRTAQLSPAPAARLTLLRVFLVLLAGLAGLHGSRAHAQGGDTVIRVGGGATTFFSENNWNPDRNTSTPTFCAAVSPRDLTWLQLEGFYPETIQDFRRRNIPKKVRIPLSGTTWMIKIFGHDETESAILKPSTDGIALKASPVDCSGKNTSGSVRLIPFGRATFYGPPDLVPAGRYASNKRFASSCRSENRDRCERIAHVQVFDKDPKRPVSQFRCPDGECSIYVGEPSKNDTRAAPPVR